jgi:dienelactone hydrolase
MRQRRARVSRFPPAVMAVPFLMAAVTAAAEVGSDAATARQRFAALVKTPVAHPDVRVEVHGTSEAGGLRVEDLSWVSLDEELVRAFVVRPAAATGRLPAIVCLHGSGGSRDSLVTPEFGHGSWTTPGRPQPHTRRLGWARELARRGYLTLSITQRGLDSRTPPINQQANVMLIRGRTAMGAILHEIRQGVTHLVSRSDVDPTRIGATGMSFGGITAFYAWILDDRLAAAAPICGGVGSVDLFARMGRIGYHGTYWWIPGIVAEGDQARFAAAMAPRPLMLWAPTGDIGMPQEAVDAFVAAVAPAYQRAGAPGALVVHQPPGEHTFSLEAFEAMERFFARYLRERPSTPPPALPEVGHEP